MLKKNKTMQENTGALPGSLWTKFVLYLILFSIRNVKGTYWSVSLKPLPNGLTSGVLLRISMKVVLTALELGVKRAEF